MKISKCHIKTFGCMSLIILAISPYYSEAQNRNILDDDTPIIRLTAPASVEDRNERWVNECDRLGGDPDDPEGSGTGIQEESLNHFSVITACEEAIIADPHTPRIRYQLARGYIVKGDLDRALEHLIVAAEANHGASLAYLGDFYLHGTAGLDTDPLLARTFYTKASESGYEPANKALADFNDETTAFAEMEKEEKSLTAQRQNGLNLAGYNNPVIMGNIYNATYDTMDVGESWARQYLYNVVDAFAGVCPGSFTQREITDLKLASIDRTAVSPEAAIGNFFNNLKILSQVSNNPDAMMNMLKGQAHAENMPSEATEDAYLFLQRNQCSSTAFSQMANNIRSYLSDQTYPANIAGDARYRNICESESQPSFYDKANFCMCFLSVASPLVSRSEKKQLLVSFWPTATRMMKDYPEGYRACQTGDFTK